MKDRHEKKFRFNKYASIGSPDAESDTNLEKVFIENGETDVLTDVSNPKCIIIGRTGSGKSALIKTIEDRMTKVKRIAPEAMSIKYISNSTILDYLRKLDVNLDFFYKVLWKHIFLVEILKLFIDDDGNKKQRFFQNLKEKCLTKFKKSSNPKIRAINYLENWTEEFWEKTEYRIKQLEEKLISQIALQSGLTVAEILALDTKSSSSKEQNTITEVKTKAEQVISDIQAQELYEIIEVMINEVFNEDQRRYYIVIDDLDKEWVSQQIVYDLISAMIEVIKEFQKFRGVKIIIALRDNLHYLVQSVKSHRGGQREKFSSLYLELKWTKEQLMELIDKRIKLISNDDLNFKKVFEAANKGKQHAFDYILDRTFYRPRDVISYVNKLLSLSNSKSFFPYGIIKAAESQYSIERFHAIEDEWNENYGDISKFCEFLVGMYNGFKFINIKEDSFAEFYVNEDASNSSKGSLKDACDRWRNNKIKFKDFIKEVILVLYRIGIVGIKKDALSTIQYFYTQINPINISDFGSDTKIYVHRAFYAYLKINVKEQDAEYLG